MTGKGPQDDDFDGEDADLVLAGEYVLGVLDRDARRAAEARIARDPSFAALIARWEDDFAPFNDAYREEAAPARLYAGIERRLFPEPVSLASSSRWWEAVTLWRGLALASGALALLLLIVNLGLLARPDGSRPTLIAELSSEGTAPINLIASYSAEDGAIAITPVAASQDDMGREQTLQLWLVREGDAPVPLGLVPADGQGALTVDPGMRDLFAEGAVFAISLEPAGGSPTGQPTGPIVASGTARAAPN
jgi:anti-sigma-K factor RskA